MKKVFGIISMIFVIIFIIDYSHFRLKRLKHTYMVTSIKSADDYTNNDSSFVKSEQITLKSKKLKTMKKQPSW